MATRPCPFCAEEIQAAALVCRFCSRSVRPGDTPEGRRRAGLTFGAISVGLVMALTAAVMSFLSDGAEPDSPAATQATTQAPEQKGSAELDPNAPDWERVHEGVKIALGGEKRIQVAELAGDKVIVMWFISDGFTHGLISDGARVDTYRILQAIAGSKAEYRRAVLTGLFPVADQLGRERNRQVLQLQYDKNTIDAIDWNGFRLQNIYEIASTSQVEQSFR